MIAWAMLGFGCVGETSGSSVAPPSKPVVYDPAARANADVTAAIDRARTGNKLAIIVMGADWCHDSQHLAALFAKPRFAAMLSPLYEIVLVDVGQRDRNIDVARRFGISEIAGTPTVLIVSPRGDLLNKADAASWRNAASRKESDVYAYFESFRRMRAR